MAAATNTTLGTICVAGDLAGTGCYPQLVPSGVKPGTYVNVSKIHIDSKGRVVWCGGANYEDDIAPIIYNASKTQKGITQVGYNINCQTDCALIDGVISVDIGSKTKKGIIQLGNNLEINQSTGAVDVTVPTASAATRGIMQVGSELSITNGVLSRTLFAPATKTSKGMVIPGTGFNISAGILSVPDATDTVTGVAMPDSSNLYLDTSTGTLYPHFTNYMLYGMVAGWSSDFYKDADGKLCYTSPYASTPATASTLGMVKIGSGITVSPTDGEISIYPVECSTTSKGLVTVGQGFNVYGGILSLAPVDDATYGVAKINYSYFDNASGTITPKDATSGSKGVVQVGSNINVGNGIISVADASDTALGVAKVGANISFANGVISVPLASTTVKGLVQPSSTVKLSSGVLSIDDATTTSLGIVKIGQGFTMSGDILSATLPSTTDYGIASYGAGLTVAAGVVSFNTDASASAKGKIQIGSGFNISTDGNAVISVADATTSSLGLVQPGTNINIASGVISAPIATDTVKGVFKIDSSISLAAVTDGVTPESGTTGLRLPRAHYGSPTVMGCLRESGTGNISIVNGSINTGSNVPLKNSFNIYTQAQIVQKNSYVSQDWSLGNVIEIIMTTDITSIPAPTNAVPGQIMTLIFKQDATGGRNIDSTAWDTVYKFMYGTKYSLSAPAKAANAQWIVSILCKSSTEYLVLADTFSYYI